MHATGWRPCQEGPPSIDVFRSVSFSQVSRFLVVSPKGRCSAEEALAHPFFQQYKVEEVRHFSPRGKFKVLKLACHSGPRGRCYRPLKSKLQVPFLGTPYVHGVSRAPALLLPPSPVMVAAQLLAPTALSPAPAVRVGMGVTGAGGGQAGTLGQAQRKPHKPSWQTSSGPAVTDRQGNRPRVGPALRPGPPQVIALTVLASVRIYYQYRRVKPVTREIVIRDPYALRPLRRLIDAYAFRLYGHWVKKGQQQNRAALFENTPKAVLLSLAEEVY